MKDWFVNLLADIVSMYNLFGFGGHIGCDFILHKAHYTTGVETVNTVDYSILLEKTKEAVRMSKDSVKQLAKLKLENAELVKLNHEYMSNGIKLVELVDNQVLEINEVKNIVAQYEVKLNQKNIMVNKMTDILDEYKTRLIELSDWKQRAMEHMKVQKMEIKGLKIRNKELMNELKQIKILLDAKKD